MSDYFHKFITKPIYSVAKVFTRTKTTQEAATTPKPPQEVVKQVIVSLSYENLPRHSKNLIRLAGLSGFLAICASAYGAHAYRRSNPRSDLKELYNTAQYYHLIHSVALFGLPMVKRPILTGTLWMSGMFIFCGTMYYHALTEDSSLKTLAPYGGAMLIFGWLTVFI